MRQLRDVAFFLDLGVVGGIGWNLWRRLIFLVGGDDETMEKLDDYDDDGRPSKAGSTATQV